MLKAKQTIPREVHIFPHQFMLPATNAATYLPDTMNSSLSFSERQQEVAYVRIPHLTSRPTQFRARMLFYTPAFIFTNVEAFMKVSASYQVIPTTINFFMLSIEEELFLRTNTKDLVDISSTSNTISPIGYNSNLKDCDLVIRVSRDLTNNTLDGELRVLKLILEFS